MRQKSKPDEMSAATRTPKVMPFHKTLTNLPPAYFAMVMATGILALACQLEKIPTLPGILFAINLAAYLILWALTILRIRYHPQRFLGEFGSHPRGPGFFTMVAATSVLGAQFAVQMQMAAAAQLLWWFAFADRKSTRPNSSHQKSSYAVFCLKKKKSWKTDSNELLTGCAIRELCSG